MLKGKGGLGENFHYLVVQVGSGRLWARVHSHAAAAAVAAARAAAVTGDPSDRLIQ